MTALSADVDSLTAAVRPTLYFIGVSTGQSSIQQVFPRWAEGLGLDGARLMGVDLPLNAPTADYRRVVQFIAADPLSLGALVTTHKIDLYRACQDLFDEVDPFAAMMGEVSSISKRDGRLVCHAKDPISSGLALEALVPTTYWAGGSREAFCMGAGGSSIAISWYLSRTGRGDAQPARVVISDTSTERLEHIRNIHAQLDTTMRFEYVALEDGVGNDEVLHSLSPGSLVVNATGLGKDKAGSPLSDAATFPDNAIAWELNYRGDLLFLDQARRQAATRGVRAEDGWRYFIHGWTQVIAEVFDVDIPVAGPAFDHLSNLARTAR